MITKGIILGKSATGNGYFVRIPFFENAGDVNQYMAEATVSYTPGVVNSLNEGDAVFVAFEDHFAGKPVIIGKLFVESDVDSHVGFASVESLDVSDKASLPAHTTVDGVNIRDFIDYVFSKIGEPTDA